MKFIKYTVLSLCVATSGFVANAQEAKIIPEKGRSALGGLGGVSCFNAQVALGRIASADHSNLEKLKQAASEAGGIGGGMDAALKMMADCMDIVPANEKKELQSIIDMAKTIVEEAQALVEVLKAKNTKEGLADAQKKYAAIRAKAATALSKQMGFPESVVK